MNTNPEYIIRLACANRPGIVAAVATALFEGGFNILDSQQFDDTVSDRFFVRIHFEQTRAHAEIDIGTLMAPVADRFGMQYSVHDCRKLSRVLLMVSKFDHCLADLLYRWRTGELAMDVVGIISNHPRDTYAHLNLGDIPFHHLPIDKNAPNGKVEQEQRVWQAVQSSGAELVVLARYMQILSDDLSAKLAGKCINIHHSFLPGFKGAKPYHQAHERGVKLIGATAHYVTADLDEGPIIEQDVERISHRDTPEQLVRRGRDIERRVLASAVRYHLEGRVLLNGQKTVVFPG
ncbi:formyltetrahydrofolate deformylase [Noviherbaspirillum saxi]|uniref:Formyltetrahydrofolate deformylase n=1 Tax=Noviherbaspirillum saxi TaxID=2320863 RepID=A0A3A3FIR8_9BURK|nr:formyltetrahydrofolate deformylase [Noviherbaspirillum saxi]RJF92288.1 formyltetrahydrofolate deformylase [Noviherbaspirillum saxi]